MAAVYLKKLLLKFLSYSYDAGYCWEDLPSLCFGPGFPRSNFVFGSTAPIVTEATPIVTKAAKASRYEYGYLTLPTPTIPLPMTITMAPGALEFRHRGITRPGLADVISSPGDYLWTGQLQFIFLTCMISMFIGVLAARSGYHRRAMKSQAAFDRLTVAHQNLERESECRTKEQAEQSEQSERQKRILIGILHSQRLRLGTKSRAMRDRLTRRRPRFLSRAQNKPATVNHNDCYGPESQLVGSEMYQVNERLSIHQLNSEICETKVKLGRVTRCLQDALLHDGSAIAIKTQLSAAEILGATRTARRSSVSRMEGLQGSRARPSMPHRRRSMSAVISVSVADTHSSITNSAESMSLREIVAMLRLVRGDTSSQPGQEDGSGVPKDDDGGEETCSTASQSGDGLQAEDDGIGELCYGQRPTVPKGRTKRRRRRAKGPKDEEVMDA